MRTYTHTGTITLHQNGFGFISTDDGDDFFAPPAVAQQFLSGDLIGFTLSKKPRTESEAVDDATLLHRPATLWVGEARQENGRWALLPDDPCFIPLEISNVEDLAPGQVVAVRVPAGSTAGTGAALHTYVERILGERTRAGFELDYALARNDRPVQFPPEALHQAETHAVIASQLQRFRPNAVDARSTPFVTIDGEHTQDIDDAIWAAPSPAGWEVKVAIADVAFYVREGSALDKEARRRGTSTYLPGRTVPMLPEILSNSLCSLKQGEDRQALMATLHLSPTGELLDWTFMPARIRSAAQLTYQEASRVLAAPTEFDPSWLCASLTALQSISELRKRNRLEKGALSFDDSEPILVAAEDGTRTIAWHSPTPAHTLVSEIMLLANHAAALTLYQRYGAGVFRFQPAPTPRAWQELKQWARAAGRDTLLPEEPSMGGITALIEAARDDDYPAVTAMRARKVLRPARYSAEHTSHFALGSSHYAHFTSPIRRYADLVVHRLLLGETFGGADALYAYAAESTRHARAAQKAERYVWDGLKRAHFLQGALPNAPLIGRIVAVSPKGVRALLRGWQCSIWLPGGSLLEAGLRFESKPKNWLLDNQKLEPGMDLTLRWTGIREEQGQTDLVGAPYLMKRAA